MKKLALVLIILFSYSSAKAQDGFESILLADPSDSNKLMQAYFAPAMEGFIYGMNNGWYHTAKVHKTLGFDLTIGLSGAIVPSKREMFSISGLTSINQPSGTATGSTFAGPDTETPMTVTRTLTIGGNSQEVTANFPMPGGIIDDLPLKAVPAPIAQLNIGLPFKIDAMVRFFPETDLGDDGGKAKMLGLGIKKEITDWFGPLDKLPLHVSLLAAFTNMDVTYAIEDGNNGALQTSNASAALELNSYTLQAIASLNFPFINIYGGLGYSSGKSTLEMTGTYQGTYSYGGQTITENLTPPSLKFDASGFKSTIGARISLGPLKIFGDYTLQEYNTISAGIAISIR